jgi:hypothetical protein
MSYMTIHKPATERAAAAVLGAVTGLIVGGQDDAARYVIDQLGRQLLRDVHSLTGDRTDPALVAWLRERVDIGQGQPTAVPAGPGPVADPDAEGPVTTEEELKRALRVMLPPAVQKAVTSAEAFPALAYRVGQAMDGTTGLTARDVLSKLGKARFALVGGMNDPAAYLAKHVKECWELD